MEVFMALSFSTAHLSDWGDRRKFFANSWRILLME